MTRWTTVCAASAVCTCLVFPACGRAPTGGTGTAETGATASTDVDLGSPGSESGPDDVTSSETDSGGPDLPDGECIHVEFTATSELDLEIFEGVDCFTGFVAIDASFVGDLSSMASLREGGSVIIQQSEPALLLSDLTSLEMLESLESLGVSAGLTSLTGLESLVWAHSIDFRPGPFGGIASLEGLGALTVVEHTLALGQDDGEPTPGPKQVVSLLPLSNLESCGRLHIVGLDGLTSLDGLESLQSLEFIALTKNLVLADIHGLDNVESNTDGMTIRDNPELPTCDAIEFADRFPNLLPQQIWISDNLPDACGG